MEELNVKELEESRYGWIRVDEAKCIRCGICIDMCPMDVLHFSSKGYPFMRYRDDCWYCEACSFLCPAHALAVTEMPYLIS